jgi:hypothetical protein
MIRPMEPSLASPLPTPARSAKPSPSRRGPRLAEVISKGADISVLTLRFNKTQSFTAAPVYPEGGPPLVGPSTGGTLSGQTLTFNATSGGMYGPNNQKFLGQKLVLTVEDFTLKGSPPSSGDMPLTLDPAVPVLSPAYSPGGMSPISS